jgi:5-deoxy-D-glucuronate isomerase
MVISGGSERGGNAMVCYVFAIQLPGSVSVRILANCPIQEQNIFSSFEAHKHDKHTQYTNGLSGIGLKFCN